MLEKQSKEIIFKFDILNKTNFEEALNHGCQVLHLAFDYTDEDNFIFEDDLAKIDKISLKPFEDNTHNLNI